MTKQLSNRAKRERLEKANQAIAAAGSHFSNNVDIALSASIRTSVEAARGSVRQHVLYGLFSKLSEQVLTIMYPTLSLVFKASAHGTTNFLDHVKECDRAVLYQEQYAIGARMIDYDGDVRDNTVRGRKFTHTCTNANHSDTFYSKGTILRTLKQFLTTNIPSNLKEHIVSTRDDIIGKVHDVVCLDSNLCQFKCDTMILVHKLPFISWLTLRDAMVRHGVLIVRGSFLFHASILFQSEGSFCGGCVSFKVCKGDNRIEFAYPSSGSPVSVASWRHYQSMMASHVVSFDDGPSIYYELNRNSEGVQYFTATLVDSSKYAIGSMTSNSAFGKYHGLVAIPIYAIDTGGDLFRSGYVAVERDIYDRVTSYAYTLSDSQLSYTVVFAYLVTYYKQSAEFVDSQRFNFTCVTNYMSRVASSIYAMVASKRVLQDDIVKTLLDQADTLRVSAAFDLWPLVTLVACDSVKDVMATFSSTRLIEGSNDSSFAAAYTRLRAVAIKNTGVYRRIGEMLTCDVLTFDELLQRTVLPQFAGVVVHYEDTLEPDVFYDALDTMNEVLAPLAEAMQYDLLISDDVKAEKREYSYVHGQPHTSYAKEPTSELVKKVVDELTTITAADTHEMYLRSRATPLVLDIVPNKQPSVLPVPYVSDVANSIQLCYDSIVGDSVLHDVKFDPHHVEYSPATVSLDKVTILDWKGVNPADSIRKTVDPTVNIMPVLRTNQAVDRPHSVKETLLALMKRNANVTYNTAATTDALFDAMIENFFDKFCVPDARERMKEFMEQKIRAHTELFRAWAEKTENGKLSRINCDGKALRTEDVAKYKLDLKKTPKNDLEDKATQRYAALQTIVHHDSKMNAAFSSMMTEIHENLESVLKPEVCFMQRKSIAEIEEHMNKFVPLVGAHVSEVDFSKYDKSQGPEVLSVQDRLFKKLGFEDSLLRIWSEGHEHTRATDYAMGIRILVEYQRKSGDATTCIGNTAISMICIAWMYRDVLDIIAAYFLGDDSLVYTRTFVDRELERAEEARKALNLEAKLQQRRAGYFCSSFVINNGWKWRMVPDPFKRAERLGQVRAVKDIPAHDLLLETHISFADSMVALKDFSNHLPLVNAMRERYEPAGNYEHLLCALNTAALDFRAYASLFRCPPKINWCLSAAIYSVFKIGSPTQRYNLRPRSVKQTEVKQRASQVRHKLKSLGNVVLEPKVEEEPVFDPDELSDSTARSPSLVSFYTVHNSAEAFLGDSAELSFRSSDSSFDETNGFGMVYQTFPLAAVVFCNSEWISFAELVSLPGALRRYNLSLQNDRASMLVELNRRVQVTPLASRVERFGEHNTVVSLATGDVAQAIAVIRVAIGSLKDRNAQVGMLLGADDDRGARPQHAFRMQNTNDSVVTITTAIQRIVGYINELPNRVNIEGVVDRDVFERHFTLVWADNVVRPAVQAEE